jgi:beta-galactosidase/beta-glucuronidase
MKSVLPYSVAMCSLLGIIKYIVEYKNKQVDLPSTPQCTVTVFEQNGKKVTSVKGVTGKIHIPKANFWWPYLTNPHPGYLYTLKVSLGSKRIQFIHCEVFYFLTLLIAKVIYCWWKMKEL